MLDIGHVGDLANRLRTTTSALYKLASSIDDHIAIYDLHVPGKSKIRTVISPQGRLRKVQDDLLRTVFVGRVKYSSFSFGGVPGRSARTHASRHAGSNFLYTTDIANFFPSIKCGRVQNIFEQLGCAKEVASLLTRLCTFDGYLAQGLITSPLLADQAMRRADVRVAGMAKQHGMLYSRFVDDFCLSGPFRLDLSASGLVALVRRILNECGFEYAPDKEHSGRVDDANITITGLRLCEGKVDVARSYILSLHETLDHLHHFGLGEDLKGDFFTRDQIGGRVNYVCSVNRRHAKALKSRFGSINWIEVLRRGEELKLVVCRKRLVKKLPTPTGL